MFSTPFRCIFALAVSTCGAYPQSINSGTINGSVKDPSGAVVSHASVQLRNPVTGYQQSTLTDNSGAFRLNNIPQNNYRLMVSAPGFAAATQEVDVRSSRPLNVDLSLTLAEASTTMQVTAVGASVETDPSAHQDVDRSSIL